MRLAGQAPCRCPRLNSNVRPHKSSDVVAPAQNPYLAANAADPKMKLPKRTGRIGAFAIAIALILVLNPEIRALLLLANTLGLEVVVLLVITQLRSFAPVVIAAAQTFAASFCALSLQPAQNAMQLTVGLIWARQLIAQPAHAASIFISCIKCRSLQHNA